MVQSVKPKQRKKTILSLSYLRFSEADVGLMLLEENGLVAQELQSYQEDSRSGPIDSRSG